VTHGLQQRFGVSRVVDTPLAEGAIIGAAVGLAVGGMIPVPEIKFLGFSYQAFHQIVPQLARFRSRSHGRFDMPVTVRAPCGGGLRTPESEPGDLTIADETVVCFLPGDRAAHLLTRILDVVREEQCQRVGDR
jgi:pyruvate/2-oxoglutarate/acetoin dehydrogenase E1 component